MYASCEKEETLSDDNTLNFTVETIEVELSKEQISTLNTLGLRTAKLNFTYRTGTSIQFLSNRPDIILILNSLIHFCNC